MGALLAMNRKVNIIRSSALVTSMVQSSPVQKRAAPSDAEIHLELARAYDALAEQPELRTRLSFVIG